MKLVSTMSTLRESYVEHFGEEQAVALEEAAQSHANGVNSTNLGDDPFRWAFLIAWGYQCFKYHGIGVTEEQARIWASFHAELIKEHNGDVDYLSAFTGRYAELVGGYYK